MARFRGNRWRPPAPRFPVPSRRERTLPPLETLKLPGAGPEHVTVGGRGQTAVGVVLGQGQGSDTPALLAAAGEAAEQLVGSLAPA